MPCETFWKNKRVLITGHTGFKGAWLGLWLKKLGAKVYGFGLNPEKDSLFERCKLESMFDQHLLCDLANFSTLKEYVDTLNPEVVFHLAAQALVKDGYVYPLETFNTNVQGTNHLLEVLRLNTHWKVLINVTTDKCYENKEWVWGYRENDSLGGKDPYSASKACSEILTHAYNESFFKTRNPEVGVATVRAGNIFGGGDYANNRLIPDCIRAFNATTPTPLSIRYPQATRPWQFVLEGLNAYINLAEKLAENPKYFSGPYNIAPEETAHLCVGDLAKMIFAQMGNPDFPIEVSSEQHMPEANALVLSCHKAQKYFQFRTKWSLKEALYATVDWYKNAMDSKNDMKEYSFQMIEKYSRI